ncbi:MAG: Mrp/NBP35 family ATP-binding protein [Alphaproteobacteria bacterium]|nr:P-loop NTPase [Alphaproteobacteria bacterium]MDE2336121.1 Mrp/NBP35 family ATP-binding protein [Alphaproteobacteria bacterium]
MTAPTAKTVHDCLKSIPGLTPDMVSGISVDAGKVVFAIEVEPSQAKAMEPVRRAAEEAVRKMDGVASATAVLTAERKAPPQMQAKQPMHKVSQRPVAPQVKHIVAVASGKGGVGKSTVAANLAHALKAMGKKTGLLDADIYGASQPRMMGLRERPETDDAGLIIPPEAHGLKLMSMGFFVEETAPVIWRGPMVHAAIQQLLRDVAWGELDILVIDLPPGTGDAQLSLVQNVPLSGAVIVSTPQDVALSEAAKGLLMFQKVGVPVLGFIENMSYHICSSCGHREEIFSHGGARAAAEKMNVPFLGEIPLDADVRIAADAGATLKNAAIEEVFKNIAARIWMTLPAEKTVPRPPKAARI